MFYIIYKTTNKINGKEYTGKHKTKDIKDGYMGSGKELKLDIKKYGVENFSREILFALDSEAEMDAKEAELVTKEYCLREDTYNIVLGGKGGWGYVHENNLYGKTILTPEQYKTWAKIGKEACNKKYPNGTFLGRKHKEETLQKMRKPKNVGASNSQYGTMWITNGSENKKIKKENVIPDGWYKGRI